MNIIKETTKEASKVYSDAIKYLLDNGINIFAEIDHEKNALNVGMKLDFNRVIIFGKPLVGTLLMEQDPSVGIDLPLKLHIFKKGNKTIIQAKDIFELKNEYPTLDTEILNKMSKYTKEIIDSIL